MSKKSFIASALLFTLIVPGGGFMGKPLFASPKDEPAPRYDTRVFIRNNCLIRPKPQAEFVGALAAIFLPMLIEKLLGGAGAALKKAGSDETLKDAGRLPTYLYQLTRGNEKKLKLNPDLKCVIVVRGSFDKSGEAQPTDVTPSVSKLRNGKILVREIALVYEAAVEIADDNTALRYEGRYFEVNRFLGSNPKKNKSGDRRAIVVSIAISGAGEKEGEPVLSLAMINIGEVNGGTILEPDDLAAKQSSWLGGLAITDASLKAIETGEFSNHQKGSTEPINVMPVTIDAVVAETSSGNAALKFIGEVLDASKTDAAKAISGEVLGQGKKKEEAASALEKLRGEEETAYAALLSAESELAQLAAPHTPAESAAREVRRFAVESAGRTWCVKFEALSKLGFAPTRPAHSCPVVVPN